MISFNKIYFTYFRAPHVPGKNVLKSRV